MKKGKTKARVCNHAALLSQMHITRLVHRPQLYVKLCGLSSSVAVYTRLEMPF